MHAKRTKTPTCIWPGASGVEYEYYVHKLPASLKTGQNGNYIYARQNPLGQWVRVYIGEGDLGERSAPLTTKPGASVRKERPTSIAI